jgi:DNA ligase-1
MDQRGRWIDDLYGARLSRNLTISINYDTNASNPIIESDKMPFKPMLAQAAELDKLRFPLLASAKLDGIRALAMDGKPMSRAMKVIPNRAVQEWFQRHAEAIEGMDGELIVGTPTDPRVCHATTSAMMSFEGEPDFSYFVFDRHNIDPMIPYDQRIASLPQSPPDRVHYLEAELIESIHELEVFEQKMLDIGYEGVILRDPKGRYKQGRATVKEGSLLKLKRYADAEAVIIGFAEEMFNGNEATVNELGRTKRSSHQANKTGKDTLGTLIVRGLTAFEGQEFRVGGFDAATRAMIWQNRERYLDRIVKFKYFNVGIKDLPRHPNFLSFRDAIDL